MRRYRFSAGAAAITFAALIVPTGLQSQVTSASAAALGLGDNFTAAARGFNAVAWNPATLALRGTPNTSLTFLAMRGGSGLAPVSLSDLSAYSNQVVPDAVRQDWLARIAADGAQRGEGEVEATWAALQFGHLALHAGTRVRALTDVSPGVAELVMFGNAGQDGSARDLDLSGSSLAARAYTTFAASLALPYEVEAGRLSIGATVTYTIGHVFAGGDNSVGRSTAQPIGVQLDFPLVQTRLDDLQFNGGSGVGLDVGAALESGPLTVSAVAHNVRSSFAWRLERLEYRPLSFDITEQNAQSRTDAQPFASAPADVRERIAEIGFEPSWSFGVAFRPSDRLLTTADARFAKDDGMFARPVRHIGAGVELHVLPWLPLRAGGALVSQTRDDDGWLAGAGLGVKIGTWGMNAALARRDSGRLGASTLFMISATAIGVW